MGETPLPQSNALAEAETDSLSVLMAKDPEEYMRQEIDRVVEALRAQRVRFEASQVAKPERVAKKGVSLATASGASAAKLGL